METNTEPYWKLSKIGIDYMLNNQESLAEELFNKYPDNFQMNAGYAVMKFMESVMTFEDQTLETAGRILKETEKKCTTGWFRPFRDKNGVTMGYIDNLEMQIIRADMQLCAATLTFLQMDISSYLKGAWVLRKAWRNYQQIYDEISQLYKEVVGDDDGKQDPTTSNVTKSDSDEDFDKTQLDEMFRTNEAESSKTQDQAQSNISPDEPPDKKTITRNGYIPKSQTIHFPQHASPSNSIKSTDTTNSNSSGQMRKSQSMGSTLTRYNNQLQKNLARLSSPINSSLQYISSLNPFFKESEKEVELDKETVKRLMCSISFGCGLIQLGMSLLPPSILKLSNFLGFKGDRRAGLNKLMYARIGSDVHAPLATLAILWYHTIVRPFFALDGHNVRAGVEVAADLINEAMTTYSTSSLFLFFKGRVERLKGNIPEAIKSFNTSVDNSNQREVKILSQHEVGWCYLIELDYKNAFMAFMALKHISKWSHAFYMYLCIISAGSNGSLENLCTNDDVISVLSSHPKGSQLDEYLSRRFKVCPKTSEELLKLNLFYWRLLVYELLYLWNSLASCNLQNINAVIKDCRKAVDDKLDEPYIGLTYLVMGSAYALMNKSDDAVECFKMCIEKRANLPHTQRDDLYVSAFALYELGQILIKNPETKLEGKAHLQRVNDYKDYDFDTRLTVRINSMLKNL